MSVITPLYRYRWHQLGQARKNQTVEVIKFIGCFQAAIRFSDGKTEIVDRNSLRRIKTHQSGETDG